MDLRSFHGSYPAKVILLSYPASPRLIRICSTFQLTNGSFKSVSGRLNSIHGPHHLFDLSLATPSISGEMQSFTSKVRGGSDYRMC